MELIDRLGVMKALDEAKIKTTSEEYDRIIDVIGSMPTIEEQKTGRWVEHDDFDNSWECSSCNEVIDIIEGTPMDNEYRFCPLCGAKMEMRYLK